MKIFRLVLPVALCTILSVSLAAMESNTMDVEQPKSADPTFILLVLHELELQGLLPHDVSLLIIREYHCLQTLLDSKEYRKVLEGLKEVKPDPYYLRNLLQSLCAKFGINQSVWLLKIALKETNKKLEDIRDSDDSTVLHWAANYDYPDVVKLALRVVNDPYHFACMKNKWAALHMAAIWGHFDCVTALLAAAKGTQQAREMILLKDYYGETVFDWAQQEGYNDPVQILQAYLDHELGSPEFEAILKELS